jgi:hypothetical protein
MTYRAKSGLDCPREKGEILNPINMTSFVCEIKVSEKIYETDGDGEMRRKNRKRKEKEKVKKKKKKKMEKRERNKKEIKKKKFAI